MSSPDSQSTSSTFPSPDVIFVLFLPALLFESSLNIDIKHLRENFWLIVLLAVIGVAVATAITGFAVHPFLGLPVLTALLFGSLISANDPIAVTAQVDEPRIEITLTTIVAYGSYLLAEHLHVSGVISTVVAGLTIGIYGAQVGMSPRTRGPSGTSGNTWLS